MPNASHMLQGVHAPTPARSVRAVGVRFVSPHLSMPEVISRSLNLEKPVGVAGAAALNRDLAEPTSEPAHVSTAVNNGRTPQRALWVVQRRDTKGLRPVQEN